jgi:hypothetical protein
MYGFFTRCTFGQLVVLGVRIPMVPATHCGISHHLIITFSAAPGAWASTAASGHRTGGNAVTLSAVVLQQHGQVPGRGCGGHLLLLQDAHSCLACRAQQDRQGPAQGSCRRPHLLVPRRCRCSNAPVSYCAVLVQALRGHHPLPNPTIIGSSHRLQVSSLKACPAACRNEQQLCWCVVASTHLTMLCKLRNGYCQQWCSSLQLIHSFSYRFRALYAYRLDAAEDTTREFIITSPFGIADLQYAQNRTQAATLRNIQEHAA